MYSEIITLFLVAAVILYCLFAGADFGAGILEIFRGKNLREEQRELITHAMGPVWEANHVWLILAVVILFSAFPKVYSLLSIRLHIPLTFMLMGIILRGCAFTFRHYDAVQGRSQRYYSLIFMASSLVTPFFLGTIAAAVFNLGSPEQSPGTPPDFYAVYVAPWANPFCFSVGLFTCILFALLAAVYLVGETTEGPLKTLFIRRAKYFNVAAIAFGPAVFLCAQCNGIPLLTQFLANPVSLACMILATLLLGPLWRSLATYALWARICAAGQVTLILLGWFHLQSVNAGTSALALALLPEAEESALKAILIALICGIILIVPSFFFLMRIFKRTKSI